MKQFSFIFIFTILTIATFAQSKPYFTVSAGYPMMEHYGFNSITVRTSISNINLNPSFTIGFGYQIPIRKKINGNLLFDITHISGNADYDDAYFWMVKKNGILDYKFTRLRFAPSLDLEIIKSIHLDIGVLITRNFSSHSVEGTKTTYGYYDSIVHTYNPPIQTSITNTYINLPKFSGGFFGTLSYSVNNKLKVWGRYGFDKGFALGGNAADFLNIQQFSLGLDYYFKNVSD